jgi:YVTN family beta-propeller protein
VTVGGLNLVKVFRTEEFEQVAAIETGALPHGLWPSGDGTRIYVGVENGDVAAAIDTLENKVIATVPVGQAPQGVAYVPGAVPSGDGLANLQPGGVAAQSIQLKLSPPGGKPATQVTLFNQGLVQVLQAAVTGLEPKKPYALALTTQADGGGKLEPIASFMTNPVGAAVVNSLGPIRQVVEVSMPEARRYLVIAPGSPEQLGPAVQVQMP